MLYRESRRFSRAHSHAREDGFLPRQSSLLGLQKEIEKQGGNLRLMCSLFTPRLFCLSVTEHNSISFKMCPSRDTAGEGGEAM